DGSRVFVYVAAFVVAILAPARASAGRWCDGIALAIVGVTIAALASRFFPGTFTDVANDTFLPGTATRLSYPIGYWNGLAILVALACPLLLRVAVTATARVTRGLAVAALPAVATTIYLASSRSGAIAA